MKESGFKSVPIIIAIIQELFRAAVATCRRSATARLTAVAVGLVLAINVTWFVWGLLFSGAQGTKYRAQEFHGSVAYVDGGLVPVPMMLVKFFPLASHQGDSVTTTPVTAKVETSTGRFRAKWIAPKELTGSPVRCRVVVLSGDQGPLADSVVPSECGDPDQTPLCVDLGKGAVEIRIKKPVDKGVDSHRR